MPIEIRELVIKATVTGNEDSNEFGQGQTTDNRELIDLCVEQVLAILKREQER